MTSLNRRGLLTGASALGFSSASALAAPPVAWQTVAPADVGFRSDLETRLERLIVEKRVWKLHSVIVIRGRKIALERYFEGQENSWGAVRNVRFDADTLHNLYSVTKSIVGLLYGVALGEGKVPPPEAPLYAQFPEYADLVAADTRREERIIAHALTMTLALEWDEITIPYSDPRNGEIAMAMAEDRYRYILSRPVIGPPGKRWLYCGGATALLGRIIAKATGMTLPDYARAALFDPAGIGSTEWINNRETWVAQKYGSGDGEPEAASGLRMTPRDLARIGQLVLDHGVVGSREVVPASWLEQSFVPRVSADETRRFGYQWYTGDIAFGSRSKPRLEPWVGCFGNGGQRLWIIPELDLIVVTTAGNYGTDDQWVPPVRVLREAVLPSIE